MTTAMLPNRSIGLDRHKHKEKENRRIEGSFNPNKLSSNSNSNGSVPKRYQSVFTNNTPLTTFGVQNDENQLRSHSPPNRFDSQLHQQPLKPVKEFLPINPASEQTSTGQKRPKSHANNHQRLQTETTVNNVNAALAKTLGKLRHAPSNSDINNGRQSTLLAKPIPTRPMSTRTSFNQCTDTATSTNFYFHPQNGTKMPLPRELISKRPINTTNETLHNRISSTADSLIMQQHTIDSNDTTAARINIPYRGPSKHADTASQQLNEFNFNNVKIDEQYPDKSRKPRTETYQQVASRKPSSAMHAPTGHDPQHRALPEVSVHPNIQSSTPNPSEYTTQSHDRFENNEICINHQHIQVEPTNTFKQTFSANKRQSIHNTDPNFIFQRQPSTSALLVSNSSTNINAAKDPLNEAYIERDNTDGQLLTSENNHAKNNDSSSTLKQYENHDKNKNSTTSVVSSVTQELNRVWKKPRKKYSFKSAATGLHSRRTSKNNRPPGRLKNYEEDTESESTTTETQSRSEGMNRRQGVLPSDVASDAWSDFASEFSDTKFRKHPVIRTSTPNITGHSSSFSSKEVGKIRKQLTDLQIMYNDLLKLLDIDIDSMRSSVKSATSSQLDPTSRRHRFRKITPILPTSQSTTMDMREINQRFSQIESSIVALAESIAKLTTQLQAQRIVKDDIHDLRQEVAELRQQLNHQSYRQSTQAANQHQPRSLPSNIQRLPPINNSNPSNVSTSTMQRSLSIIDPKQARKIEQFFGKEAMLRYFLGLLNYEEYATILEQEKIGIYELPYINERKLQSLGIPYGPCARIIHEAQQYFISLLTLKSSGVDV